MIRIFVGFDQREAATYHTLTQSIIETTSVPVSVTPLHGPMLNGFDGQQDGTNRFIYSRFLVPELMGYQGWALYLDSDMLLLDDLADLWALRDDNYAVMVCQRDYVTKTPVKFTGTPIVARNEHYPRKNWSSLILWNCGHPANRRLTRELVAEAGGPYLHRFQWLSNEEIGMIPLEWNHLVGEVDHENARLAHYTLGAPGFANYQNCRYSAQWHQTFTRSLEMAGQEPIDMIRRSMYHARLKVVV